MSTPCLSAITYAFPAAHHSVRALAAAGALRSSASLLESFGFETVYVATAETPYDLGLRAARDLLAEHDVDPRTVDVVIYGGAAGVHAFAPPATGLEPLDGYETLGRFRYPASRLQYDLGLERAVTFALDQLGCTTLLAAVRVARALCVGEGAERVLCVGAEFYPAHAGREAIFNCTSDAACAVLVDRHGTRNRLVASATVSKGYYWDAGALRDEIVAAYFPTAKCVIDRALVSAGWSPADVDWVIPHNVSLRSWEILLGLLRLPNARLWSANIARRGHTLAGDNFINLRDSLACGDVRRGERALLFSFGYGGHWTALAVEA